MSEQNLPFFQNEKKFVVGKCYETLRVTTHYSSNRVFDLETCDEIGVIIANSEKFLGKYVKSENYGYGDNGGRKDYFVNEREDKIVHYLDYDGTTRYREVKTSKE